MNFLIRNVFVGIVVFCINTTIVGMHKEYDRTPEYLRCTAHLMPRRDLTTIVGMRAIINNDTKSFFNCLNEYDYAKAKETLEANKFIVYSRDAKGDTPLHLAVARKNPMIIGLLLEGNKYNGTTSVSNSNGDTPLTMLVKGSRDLRQNRAGFSSPRLHIELINGVGEKCTLKEVQKNLTIAEALHRESSRFMKNIIQISTIDPLKALEIKKQKITSNTSVKSNKRRQHPTASEQGNRKKHRGTVYEEVLITDEDTVNLMQEVSDKNILLPGAKRLRTSVERGSR